MGSTNLWQGVYLTFGVLSVLLSCSILLCFAVLPELLKRSFHRLLFFLCISDVFVGISCLIWFSGGIASGPRCSAQFLLFFTFRNMSALIETLMYFGLWRLCMYHKGLKKSTEVPLISLCFLLPFVLSICVISLSSLESVYYLVDDAKRTDDFALQGVCFVDNDKLVAGRIADVLYFFIPLIALVLMTLMVFHILHLVRQEKSEDIKKMYYKGHRRIKYYLRNFAVFNLLVMITSIGGVHDFMLKGLTVISSIFNAGIFFSMNRKVVRKFINTLKEKYATEVEGNEKSTGEKSESTVTFKRNLSLQHALFHHDYHDEDGATSDEDEIEQSVRSATNPMMVEIGKASIPALEGTAMESGS